MKRTLTTMLLTVSLVVNALFLYVRLEKKVYMAGVRKGTETLSKKIVNEIVTKRRLLVDAPSGGQYVLVPRKSKMPQVKMTQVQPADPNVEDALGVKDALGTE